MIHIFRMASWHYQLKVPFLPRLLYALNRVLIAAVLPPSGGKDVFFSYSCLGIVVHARCTVGNRVTIGQGVTLGARSGAYDFPITEDDVQIGGGCQDSRSTPHKTQGLRRCQRCCSWGCTNWCRGRSSKCHQSPQQLAT